MVRTQSFSYDYVARREVKKLEPESLHIDLDLSTGAKNTRTQNRGGGTWGDDKVGTAEAAPRLGLYMGNRNRIPFGQCGTNQGNTTEYLNMCSETGPQYGLAERTG